MNDAAVFETPLLITLEQAAQRLAISRDIPISRRTLERLIAAGEFPSPLKLGRSSRVAVRDVDGYCEQLRARRVQAVAGAMIYTNVSQLPLVEEAARLPSFTLPKNDSNLAT
jgi:excisionase family DNA binding protein